MSLSPQFADISSNNPSYDARAYSHEGGHVLIGIKATEALRYVNPGHAANSDSSHEHGVSVAHYLFARPDENHSLPNARREVDHFWGQVEAHWKDGDFAVYDLEVIGNETINQETDYALHAFERMHDAHGHDFVLYGSTSFLHARPRIIPPEGRIWEAAYGPHPGALPAGMHRWAWQHTDGRVGPEPHSCKGIGRCDVSTLNPATFAHLRQLHHR